MASSSASPSASTVSPAARALLNGLIDYAGLFPPARLELDDAVRRYVAYRTQPTAWMLGRFILPTRHLNALDAQADMIGAEPIPLSVLAGGGDDEGAFSLALRSDLTAIAAFQNRPNPPGRVEALELRLPPALQSTEAVYREVHALLEGLDRSPLTDVPVEAVYLELPRDAKWRRHVEEVARTLAQLNHGAVRVGLKLRCGGLDAEAFPSLADIASFLLTCRNEGIPFKATAGLHHPIRHFNQGLQTSMHGFVNVFGAAILARLHELDALETQAILAEEDETAFRFRNGTFSWRDYDATAEQLTTVRDAFATSYGSCSFDEPRADLRALGLL